jgi:glycosyl transferase family 25
MSDGSISCALNHILAYERMVKDNVPYALFFEDDPYFLGDFKKKLNKLDPEIKSLNPGFIISLENTTLTFPSFWTTKKGKYLYPAKVSRMAGAYLMDLQAVKNTLRYLEDNKCTVAMDWFHNELINEGVLRMYWAHPPLVEQGSHNGLMTGSISTRPKSLKRRIKWLINKAYKKYFRRLFPQRRIIKDEIVER